MLLHIFPETIDFLVGNMNFSIMLTLIKLNCQLRVPI